ncbi:MAG: DUF1643 domain-containing protein [Litorivicinaceae bacterium]
MGRYWGTGPIACVIGLNPSTADDTFDDPTNRRLIGLLDAQGFEGYVLVNLIPESTPYPERLGTHQRRLSAKNDAVIVETADQADVVILAWGNGAVRCPFRYRLIDQFDDPLCFGRTKAGEPKHPLYLPSTTALTRFQLD